jgi:hypothetical protein
MITAAGAVRIQQGNRRKHKFTLQHQVAKEGKIIAVPDQQPEPMMIPERISVKKSV